MREVLSSSDCFPAFRFFCNGAITVLPCKSTTEIETFSSFARANETVAVLRTGLGYKVTTALLIPASTLLLYSYMRETRLES